MNALYLIRKNATPLTPSLPLPGSSLSLILPQPRRRLALASSSLHPLNAEPAHITGTHSIARLGVPLLAAKPELGILLVPLRGRAGLPTTPLTVPLLVGALDLVLDSDVEVDGFPLAGGGAGFGAFCWLC